MLSPDQVIDLRMTVNELQVVMTALGEMPYRASAPVIESLRKQLLEADPDAFGPRPSSGNGMLQPAIGGSS